MEEHYFTDLDKLIQQKLSDHYHQAEGDNGQGIEPSSDELLFDAYIHQQLSQYEMPFLDWDWVKMNDALENVKFDKAIQAKLPTEVALVPDWDDFVSDWEERNWEIELRNKLETTPEPALPDFEEFETAWQHKQMDVHFQTELSQYQTHSQADWEEMQKDLPNLKLDEAIRTALAAHQFPYENKEWKLFLNKWQPNSNWKYVGVIGLMLLLLSAGGYKMWQSHSPKNKELVAKNTITPKQNLIPQNYPPQNSNSQNSNSQNSNSQNSNSQNSNSIKNSSISPNTTTTYNYKVYAPTSKNINAETPTSISFLQTTPSPIITAVLTQEVEVATTTAPIKPADVVSVAPIVATETTQQVEKTLPLVAPAQSVSASFSVSARDLTLQKNTPSQTPSLSGRVRWELYGAVLGSLAELKDTLHRGTAWGIRTEVPLWKGGALVTGVIGSERNFASVYYKYSSYHQVARKNLLMGNIRAMDFPILIKQETTWGKKFKFYVQGGVVPSITLKENYTHYDPTAAPNLQLPDDALARMRPVKEEVSYRPYVGNLAAATGLEYHQNRFYVGVEPSFQWAIQAFSKEQKRVHSVGLAFKTGIELGK